MKEQLITNLKRVNWEFEEQENQVMIKDFFNLYLVVSFQRDSYKVDSLLKAWNYLTMFGGMNLRQATNFNYWGYFIVGGIISLRFIDDNLSPFLTGLAYFLIVTCILQSIINLIFWGRFNTISSQINTWLRPG